MLVENAPNDYYWGCGKDGSGKNMLGQLLMKLRAEILHSGSSCDIKIPELRKNLIKYIRIRK